MKTLLKVCFSVLALGLTATATLQAQPPAGGPGAGEGRRGGGRGRGALTIETIEGAVGTLSADQKTKITAAIEKATKDREAAMAGGQPDMAKMQEINATLRTSVRATLTPEQAAKFDEALPARGPGGGGRNGPGAPGSGK